jgi:hypothetical protein
MNRVLKLVITIALFFVGRRIFATLTTGAQTGSTAAGAAQPPQRGWATQKFVDLLQSSSGSHLSAHDVRAVSIAILVYSFAVGLFAHILLGDRGFGRGLNGFIALLGAGGAVTCLNWLSPEMRENGLEWMVAVTVFSSFLTLGAAVALKAFIVSEAKDFATGNSTRTGDAINALTKSGSSDRVSQDRIQRVLRRP